MFRNFYKGALIAISLSLIFVFSSSDALAAKKAKKPKEAAGSIWGVAPRQKKMLGWSSDYPTAWTYTRADFFLRGTVLDYKKTPDGKEYEILILPIEVVNNPQHHVKLEHYKEGITVNAALSNGIAKNLKKGGVIEFNQWSKEIAGQKQGAATLVNTENHTDVQCYDTAPVAYLNKADLEPEQMINVIKGVITYGGNGTQDNSLKSQLSALAKSSNPDVSNEAKKISSLLGK